MAEPTTNPLLFEKFARKYGLEVTCDGGDFYSVEGPSGHISSAINCDMETVDLSDVSDLKGLDLTYQPVVMPWRARDFAVCDAQKECAAAGMAIDYRGVNCECGRLHATFDGDNERQAALAIKLLNWPS